MHKSVSSLFLAICILTPALAFAAPDGTWEGTWARINARRQQQEKINKANLEKELARQAMLTNRLAEGIQKGTLTSAQFAFLMRQGADVCKLLAPAVAADNAEVIGSLFNYASSCKNWENTLSAAVKQAVAQKKLAAYRALMSQGAPCLNPFEVNNDDKNAAWKPVAPPFLKTYLDRCETTPQGRSAFLRDTIAFQSHHGWKLATQYTRLTKEQAREWERGIEAMISWGVKVTDDTLSMITYQSRSITGKSKQKPACFSRNFEKFDPECSEKTYMDFNDVMRLVRLALKGKANGPKVAQYLQSDKGDWVRERYSKNEWWRLLNVLEGKDEHENRSWAARTYRKAQNWF